MSISSHELPAEETDAVFTALSNSRRRYICHLLREAPESLTIVDLSREIVRWERDGPDGGFDEDYLERVRTSLYHIHVPKLEDAGLVEYTGTRNRVDLTPTAATGVEFEPGNEEMA